MQNDIMIMNATHRSYHHTTMMVNDCVILFNENFQLLSVKQHNDLNAVLIFRFWVFFLFRILLAI